ncbi:hypothetical protein BD779DRAFT_1471854 [Infundibulicybe gibba]|nr:hypothetical protein BD779DRAFT_1471854 [Infundibulicybe gibba]
MKIFNQSVQFALLQLLVKIHSQGLGHSSSNLASLCSGIYTIYCFHVKDQLELRDQLLIKEVTVGAFSILDMDHAPVKMVVMDGIVMGPTIWIIIVVEHFVQLILLPMVHVVVCMAAKARKSIKLKHVRSIGRSGLNINKSIAGKL